MHNPILPIFEGHPIDRITVEYPLHWIVKSLQETEHTHPNLFIQYPISPTSILPE